MSAIRIMIDPAGCRRVAGDLERSADECLGSAAALNGHGLPSMPPDVAVVISESICRLNEGLGRVADEWAEEARVLEIAARIIELDQAVRGASWGLGAIEAALGAVLARPNSTSMMRLADEAVSRLLASSDVSGFSMRDWRQIAFWKAGIDPAAWKPKMGLEELDAIVRKVYAYYGSLYLDDPRFEWAGMARLVGPMFYAGWQDMYVIRNIADGDARAADIRRLLGFPDIPRFLVPDVLVGPLDALTSMTAAELRWVEQKFLSMQKQIFRDLAWQHEAFKYGGMDAIEKFFRSDDLDLPTFRAWQDIASGEPARVSRGNTALLFREQFRVIQDDYDEMRNHNFPAGWAITYAATVLAENPFDGGQAYRDFDGITVDIDPDVEFGSVSVPVVAPFVPRPDVEIRVPTGNVSEFEDRWRWIRQDMLPAFQELVRDTRAMREEVTRSFDEQANAFRRIDLDPYPD